MIARTMSVLTMLTAFLLATPSIANAGKFYNQTMVWNGITRYYRVYVPSSVPANPPLLIMLHGTSTNPADQPPTTKNFGWKPLADNHHFILVQPASSYNSKSGEWNWDAYYLDPAFQSPPDDSGFLRQLIVTLTTQYNIDPKRVFVAGMSAGAMMAQRVGVEISDLVAAIIPASGQIVGQPTLPITLPGQPVAPVSVQEWHGTNDRILQPCNNAPTLYSGYQVLMATVDDSFNYWTSQNSCTQFQTTSSLCKNMKPNPGVNGNDATSCLNNVEVQFIWESGIGHQWEPTHDEARWQFFATHPKP